MKIFIAYKFTGEDINELRQTLSEICGVLHDSGYSTYCSIEQEDTFQKQGHTHQQIIKSALNELSSSDALLAYVNSSSRSEGQLMELGYAMAKDKPIILAYKKGVNVHSSKAVADRLIEFADHTDLLKKLAELKIPVL
jgi:nucleoside 2-deoxyribosyltransferase